MSPVSSSSAMTPGSDAPSNRLVMMSSDGAAGEYSRTFFLKGESHTLGNAIKNVILQNENVTFCGYSIPHPAEDKMSLRIQTNGNVTAQEVLKKAFEDLKEICQITRKKFVKEMSEFDAQQQA